MTTITNHIKEVENKTRVLKNIFEAKLSDNMKLNKWNSKNVNYDINLNVLTFTQKVLFATDRELEAVEKDINKVLKEIEKENDLIYLRIDREEKGEKYIIEWDLKNSDYISQLSLQICLEDMLND